MRAVRNRTMFHKEYSYAANQPSLLGFIEDLLNSCPVVPLEFDNLLKFHWRIWQ